MGPAQDVLSYGTAWQKCLVDQKLKYSENVTQNCIKFSHVVDLCVFKNKSLIIYTGNITYLVLASCFLVITEKYRQSLVPTHLPV